MAQKFSAKIMFLGLEPVDESRTDPWKPNKSYKMELIKKYNAVIKEVCTETNAHFIGNSPLLKQGNYKHLLYDGLHPNTEGHKLIFEIVKNYLIKNKILL
jgi:lysophospholipase L1-like esterase